MTASPTPEQSVVVAPDAGLIAAAELPIRDWPEGVAGRRDDYQVVVPRTLLAEVRRHGRETPQVEVCGVLVGRLVRDAHGAWLDVAASIRGEHAAHDVAQVTFTAETWLHVHAVLEREHAGCEIVGWYHTHPGFGIFLSPLDRFIHDHFFNAPHQVALVDDPVAGVDGLFVWRRGAPLPEPYVVLEDQSFPADVVDHRAAAGVSVAPLEPLRIELEPTAPGQGGRTGRAERLLDGLLLASAAATAALAAWLVLTRWL